MRRALISLLVAAATVGCVGPEDSPTTVRDLRVLGISLDPPELMAQSCELSPAALATFATPLQLRALVLDPAGGGRELSYELRACAHPSDQRCEDEGDFVELERGTTAPGELVLTILPGLALLDDGTSLLQRVLERDTYKGLGGLRMPLLLRVRAGEEDVAALKLMLFSCRFFPQMEQNVTPLLPGLRLRGEPWAQDALPTVRANEAPVLVEPEDFSALEESYFVPSFELRPISLKESWKISWHTTLGTMAPGETGGTDFAGVESRQRSRWRPPSDATEQDVTVWAVVRDGRGGLSWVERRFHFVP